MTSSPITRVPTQAEVETRAREYLDLDKQLADKYNAYSEEIAPLEKRLEELGEILIADVKQFGTQHAKKSKILFGFDYEVMGTFGSTSSIDGAAVNAFREGLKKAGQTRLLNRIFQQDIRWTLKSEASKVIALAHEAGKLPSKLFILYSRCTVTKDSTPRLEVRPRQQSQTA